MIFEAFRRASLAIVTGVLVAGATTFAVRGAEPAEAAYWRATYSSASNDWRASKRAAVRAARPRPRPMQQVTRDGALSAHLENKAACVSLACPGYILLGVGF